MSTDYRPTLFLPRTSFGMKANLRELEPRVLERWRKMDLFHRLREQSQGRAKFVLHDGPPYANGHLHIGHALNKILKDVINRSQQMTSKDANYVPGWDCHGLPIEWKVEERYRESGKNKDEVPIVDFRQECREFAEHWIDVQSAEFQRLGVVGDWDNPYTTMTYAAEAHIVGELGKFLMNGALYRGAMAVMWSPVEKTALAEAEVEYKDHTSTTVHVRFPVVRASRPSLEGAAILIWTTTPWTIPGNRAVAYGGDIDYVVLEVESAAEGSLARVGERLILAEPLVEAVCHVAGITGHAVRDRFKGAALAGTTCAHPLAGMGYDSEGPALAAPFATSEEGTGIVHIAPGHGADDWHLGQEHGLEVPHTVDEDGTFYPHVPLFAGKHVFRVNDEIAQTLQDNGALLARGKLVHRYPHSWRSKAPLIFRNAEQWFISMETTGLRETALKAIDATRFVPDSGRNRLRGMIETRPDWCVSRQRAWGVPIAVFMDKRTAEPLRDQAVLDRIVAAVAQEGADAWFTSDSSRFLGNDHDPDNFDKVTDIVDVWFESGTTHGFVLEERPDLEWPASLYLEGSDQHRGWFHSSLLESCGTRGRAPYDAVLTHGFVMGEDGQKMSKSLGNIVSPQDVVDAHGADILRLWVMESDTSEDIRIGPDIIKSQVDIYRRLRNTLRFIIGNLDGFDDGERLEAAHMPELERWVLNGLWRLDRRVRNAVDGFEFHGLFVELHHFCNNDLSAFYFDIRKDALYCNPMDSTRRRAARTVLDTLFDCLTAWFAPFLCFTAEEAWMTRHPGEEESVHLRQFSHVPDAWRDEALERKWDVIRALRRAVTGALEMERAAKRIGSSLQAHPVVYADARFRDAVADMSATDTADLMITSGFTFAAGEAPPDAFATEDVPGVKVIPAMAEGEKCARCWKVLADVGSDGNHPDICGRCVDAVSKARAGADA